MHWYQAMWGRVVFLALMAFVVVALAACPSPAPPKTPEQQANEQYQKGVKYMENGKIKEALMAWEQAVKIYPQHKEAHLKLVIAYKRIGDQLKKNKDLETAGKSYQLALIHLEKLGQMMPNNPDIYYAMGEVYSAMDDYDRAIEAYNRAILLKPTDADYHFKLATAYTEKGLYRQAIDHYEDTIHLNPNYYAAYLLLGVYYEKIGDPNTAIRYYQEYVKRENRPNYYSLRGKAQQRINQLRGGGAIY